MRISRRFGFSFLAIVACAGLAILLVNTLDTRLIAQQYRFQSTNREYDQLAAPKGPLVDGGQRLSRVIQVVMPSVVHIQSVHGGERTGGRVEETGSGVIMTIDSPGDLYVVTNRHVVADAQREDISIHLYDGRVIQPQRIWTDPPTDVAVLKITGANLKPLRWGNSSRVEIGHFVLAVGSPFGLSQSSTLGIVSAKGRRALNLGGNSSVLNQDFLQTDAAINPGNSGGPLIDLHGQVIAINTAIASNSGGNDGIGFSIPSNLVRQVATQLVQYGRVRRSYLGVKLDPEFDVNKARRLQLDRLRGARVIEVHKNTPADRARLQFDDVILQFEGRPVQDENHLINLVSLTPIGSRVRLGVLRDGQAREIEVLLIDRDEYDRRSELPSQSRLRGPIRPQGLSLHALEGRLNQQLGFTPNDEGLVVLSVDCAHPLAEELRAYDVIVSAAGQPIRTVLDWDAVVSKKQPGPVAIHVRRPVRQKSLGGRSVTKSVDDRIVIWNR